MPPDGTQTDLFETEATRSLLDQLLSDSRLYTQSKDYKDVLDFVARMRNFAPRRPNGHLPSVTPFAAV